VIVRRILKIAVAVSAGLTFVYLVGMNAFLETRWFRRSINFSPEQFRVEYARAYSLWPGEIHVEGMNIRGSDGSIQWILRLDRCDFHVQFLDLVHRRFHADHVRGSGVSMRQRFRLEQQEATPDIVAAVPPVPGFSDPPYLEIGPPIAPLTDANYRLWSVELDDVDAQHVREIWIHTVRYAGDMHVRGRWLFRPVRWLEVGPATVEVNRLDVSYGPAAPFFTAMHGTIESTVHPFDVRKPQGLEILNYLSAKALLSGFVDKAELLGKIVPTPSLQVAHGEDPLNLQLVLDHGALRPGTHVEISSPASEALIEDLSIYAGIVTELNVGIEQGQSVARVDVGVSNLRVVRQDAELARAASISIQLKSRDLDLGKPSIDTGSFAVDMQAMQAPSVAFLRTFLPHEVSLDSGVVHGDGYLEGRLAAESASGQVGFTIDDLSMTRGTNRLGANVQGVLKLESGSARDGKVDLSGSRVALEKVVATVGQTHVRAASLGLCATHALLDPGEHPRLDIDVDLPAAEVTDLPALGRTLGLPEAVVIVAGAASASMHVAVDVSSLSARGSANLVARELRVQVGSDTYQGELSVALHAENGGVDRRTTILSGSTLAFTSTGAPSTDAWWARVSLGEAEMQLAGETRFRATVHLTAENASPVQALVAKLTPVPKWILDAFPMEGLHADGELRGTHSSIEARSVVAEGGGGTSVRLEYAKHEGDKEGMALLSAGSLHLGLAFAGEDQGVQLVGAESWFGRRVAVLRARSNDW